HLPIAEILIYSFQKAELSFFYFRFLLSAILFALFFLHHLLQPLANPAQRSPRALKFGRWFAIQCNLLTKENLSYNYNFSFSKLYFTPRNQMITSGRKIF